MNRAALILTVVCLLVGASLTFAVNALLDSTHRSTQEARKAESHAQHANRTTSRVVHELVEKRVLVRGRRGLQGGPGRVGDRGPRGARGARGPRGLRGMRGMQGMHARPVTIAELAAALDALCRQHDCEPKRGPTGPEGVQGEQGATGPTGPGGPPGPTAIPPCNTLDPSLGYSCAP